MTRPQDRRKLSKNHLSCFYFHIFLAGRKQDDVEIKMNGRFVENE
jgi:hypothetical protein